jgi:hypothetical protein
MALLSDGNDANYSAALTLAQESLSSFPGQDA